jgi:hypothetical protein
MKNIQFRKIFMGSICCVALLISTPASAKPIELAYRVSLLGVDIYDVDLGISLTGNSYSVKLALKAAGVAGFLSNGRIDATASGAIANQTAVPQRFAMNSNTFGEEQKLVVHWALDAKPQTSRNFEIEPKVKFAISKSLSSKTKGPLALLVSHMILSPKKTCGGSNRVYTGNAVYDYSLAPHGIQNLTGDDGSGFQGAAYKCTLTYRRVAGASGKLVEAFQDNPPYPITVWYAPFSNANTKFLMPVAARTKVKGQSVKIRLRGN